MIGLIVGGETMVQWEREKCYGVGEPNDAALPEHDTWHLAASTGLPTVFLLIKHSVQVNFIIITIISEL